MSRITLAFRCFFGLMLSGKLPARAADYLPESARALPSGDDEPTEPTEPTEPSKAETADEAKREREDAAKAEAAREDDRRAAKRAHNVAEHHRDGALALLALLQREGRLLDFLRESLDDYQDADIGAAVRDIHRGCAKVIADHLDLEPVMPGDEDDEVSVPAGFDPGEVRLIGEVPGDVPEAKSGKQAPIRGVMRHHGWRAVGVKLPALSDGVDRTVLAPAEVEVS